MVAASRGDLSTSKKSYDDDVPSNGEPRGHLVPYEAGGRGTVGMYPPQQYQPHTSGPAGAEGPARTRGVATTSGRSSPVIPQVPQRARRGRRAAAAGLALAALVLSGCTQAQQRGFMPGPADGQE